MPELLTSIFTNSTFLSMLFISVISFIACFSVGFIKIGRKNQDFNAEIFLFIILYGLSLFITSGLIDGFFGLLLAVMGSALIINLFYRQTILSNLGDEQQILLTYIIFITLTLFFEGLIGFNVLSGNNYQPTQINCNLGNFILDGAFKCVYNSIQSLFSLFTFTSTVGFFNTVILSPMFIIIVFYVIKRLRGG